MIFRFATFNAHHGKEELVPYTHQTLVESIAKLEADVVCAQELDVCSLRTYFSHQPKMIAKRLGYFVAPLRVRFYGVGFQYNAIFSRFPIVEQTDLVLPRGPGEQVRKAQFVTLDIDGQHINVANTHLHSAGRISNPNPRACEQLRLMLRYCEEGGVRLVGGDCNLLRDDVVPISEKFGFDAPHEYKTSQAKKPKYQIDWLLGKDVEFNNIEVSGILSSDHRALIANVRL